MFPGKKPSYRLVSFATVLCVLFSGFQPVTVFARSEDSLERKSNAEWMTTKPDSVQQDQDVIPTDTPVPTERPLPTETPIPVADSLPVDAPASTDAPSSEEVIALAVMFYVKASGGSDANTCLSVALACATINGALGKATAGDTINVAVGTYTNAGTGSEVARIMKSITLLGGWNAAFTAQSGMSTIDGQGLTDGIYTSDFADPNITVSIDRFTITNATQGIHNGGRSEITVNNSTITANGFGIYNGGPSLTLNNSSVIGNINNGIRIEAGGNIVSVSNSTISGNTDTGISYSGSFSPSLTISNSTISSNAGGGVTIRGSVFNPTSVNIINSTIVNNTTTAIDVGGGIRLYNDYGINLTINNSTISGNSASLGGGFYNEGVINTVTMRNTILANNTAATSPDCFGVINTSDHNVIGSASGCTVTAGAGDKFNVNPLLNSYLIGAPAYYALLSGSPAINAGNSATCLSTDQRGITRPQGGVCDIGAYEYTAPGPAIGLTIISGNNQSTAPTFTFPAPLKVMALDNLGAPVPGVSISFTAPASGASGTFTSTGTRISSINTDINGASTTSAFTANNQLGSYIISASASGVSPVNFNLQNVIWYVATTGNDSNSCTNSVSPCATINGAIGKAASGNTVYIATGTYPGTGSETVLVNKSIILLGGWNANFTTQSGMSTIDGQNARRGITVNGGNIATIERFIIQNGGGDGNGIYNAGTLTLNKIHAHGNFRAIQNNAGTLTINNSAITNNIGLCGGGIFNGPGTLTINNSTISGNGNALSSNCAPISGLANSGGTVSLNNTTISHNINGGIWSFPANSTNLKNSLVAGNTLSNGGSADCNSGDVLNSLGYNLIGSAPCTLNSVIGDQIGTSNSPINPYLNSLQDNGGPTLTHALMAGSPAINAGNPAAPGSGGNACLATDQRGTSRPVNTACDIGAFEGEIPVVQISGNTRLAGTILSYTIGIPQTVTSNGNGNYLILVPVGWSGTVTPSKSGFTFVPVNKTYSNVVTNQTSQNYIATLAPLIQDPSFEAYTPNPYWVETSTNFGTPLCIPAFCGNGAGTAAPRTGSVWSWFGGVPVDETASLSQTINFPSGIPDLRLNFYFWIGAAAPGSDAGDRFIVWIDGVPVFLANATQISSYASYTLVSVDVSAYSDGAAHTITFSSETTGQLVTFNLDDVALALPTIACDETTGSSGAAMNMQDEHLVLGLPSSNNVASVNGGSTTGVFRPGNGLLYLKNTNTTGFADVAINYGTGGDYPITGDWDGNGTDTIGIYRNGLFYLRNSNTLGFADIVFAFGAPGDQPVAGDWDGDGIDTIGVYRSSAIAFCLRNSNSAGVSDTSFLLGIPGDIGIAGDWNGDGMDTTGVFRPSNGIIFLKNANTSGFADVALNYGLSGDMPVTGDWNNDGIDTIGVYRNAQFLLRNSNTIGFADIVFALGNPDDMPIAGNWDGLP